MKAISRKTRAHVTEESDNGRVPMNHSNKDGKLFAESEEGRPLIKENIRQPNNVPDTERETRVTRADECAESSTGKQGDEVHRLAPPSDGRSATGKLPFAETKSGPRGGRRNMAGV